jgi:diguanylate cyclase (GGDEF)-like protein
MNNVFFYYELNIICLLLLFWIISRAVKDVDKQTGNILFIRTASVAAVILLLDVTLAFLAGKPGTGVYIMMNAMAVIRYSLSGVFVLQWFSYTLCVAGHRKVSTGTRFLYSVPAFFLIAGSVVSPWMNVFFTIQPGLNIRTRDSFYFVHRLIVFLYYFSASVIAALSLTKSQNTVERSRLFTIITFIIIPLCSGFADMAVPVSENGVIAGTVSLLFVFSDIQILQISTDGLTGLNNRRQFDEYVETRLRNANARRKQYLFMMDVDRFKLINDTYGHPEGDNALVAVADILRGVFGSQDAFLARFGGDEFIAICGCADDEEAEHIRQRIYDAFTVRNTGADVMYQLMVSAGYASYGEEGKTAGLELIKRADQSLYAEKEAHHAKRVN